jgi:4-amino-4-deoxy-L-arabinose transferase-like glycosyltransferase
MTSVPTAPADTGTRPARGPRPAARGWRVAAARLRPPRPLAALLLLTALLGVAWSLVTPAFQAPDENKHFAYLQELGEDFDLPGQPGRPTESTEHVLANSASNAEQAAQQIGVNMEWSERAYERWRAAQAQLPSAEHGDGGGPNPASPNPPLYYLYEVPAYRLGASGDIFTRLQLARLASVFWLLVTVMGVWLLAGEVFRRDRLLQLAAAGTAALLPMVQFISASVNPDAMLYALWTIALWLGVRLLKRGLSVVGCGLFFGVVGAAMVVKATSIALLPGAALVFLIAAVRHWRASGGSVRTIGAAAAASLAGLALTDGVWIAVSKLLDRAAAAQLSQVTTTQVFNLRELASYLWSYYLPELPFQQGTFRAEPLPVYDVWFKTSWASFGWLEVTFPWFVYAGLLVITAVVLALALSTLWRVRQRIDRATFAFLAVVALALLAGLHWTEYWWMRSDRGPFNTGRYLFPLVGVAGLVVAAAAYRLRPSSRRVFVAVALSGLFVFDLFSLGLVMERFYA